MVMDENIEVKQFLEDFRRRRLIKKGENSAYLTKYLFVNKDNAGLVGTVALTPNFDILYMSFDGKTNKYFATGERLNLKDIEKFIISSIEGPVYQSKSLFGKESISIGNGIVLDKNIHE